MNLLIRIMIVVAVSQFLRVVLDKKFDIGKRFFQKNKRIKIVLFIVFYIILNGIIGAFFDDYISSYAFYVMQGVFLYFIILLPSTVSYSTK